MNSRFLPVAPAAAVAVLAPLIAVSSLLAYDRHTDAGLQVIEEAYRERSALEQNLLILPSNETAAFDETTLARLAASRAGKFIRHKQAFLQAELEWPERRRTVIGLYDIPSARQSVRPGSAVLGHDLHASEDSVIIRGRELIVAELRPQAGPRYDAAIWLNLADAQALLDAPGRIDGIHALSCTFFCTDALDGLESLISLIEDVLPEAGVVDPAKEAMARELALHTASRASGRAHRAMIASALAGLVALAAGAWTAYRIRVRPA